MEKVKELRDCRFICGSSPRISVEPKIEVLDSHGFRRLSPRDERERIATIADNPSNLALAQYAAVEICKVLRPLLPYIEAIKISYYVNLNLGESWLIRGRVVLVDPLAGEEHDALGGVEPRAHAPGMPVGSEVRLARRGAEIEPMPARRQNRADVR